MESDFALEIEDVVRRFTRLRDRLLSTIESCESRLKREEARLKTSRRQVNLSGKTSHQNSGRACFARK